MLALNVAELIPINLNPLPVHDPAHARLLISVAVILLHKEIILLHSPLLLAHQPVLPEMLPILRLLLETSPETMLRQFPPPHPPPS